MLFYKIDAALIERIEEVYLLLNPFTDIELYLQVAVVFTDIRAFIKPPERFKYLNVKSEVVLPK
ncbi:MAG: hypothetical protein ABR572_07420 [Cryomorphaceae bacterium]